MINILIHGYTGAMGRVVENLIKQDKSLNICERINSQVCIFDSKASPDVIIDFSTAKVIPNLLNYAKNKQVPVVLCTTGLDLHTENMVLEVSKSAPIFKSANMSLGVNLISSVLKEITPILQSSGFDIEIIEKHHNKKIDSPSGTALLLANSINEGLDNSLEHVYDRTTLCERRKKTDIGVFSVRGGTIVGEHEIIFAGNNEVIEIKHSAQSKEIFAAGAIKAAKFIVNKKSGIYDMQDLLTELGENYAKKDCGNK